MTELPAADIPDLLAHLRRTAGADRPALTFYRGRTLSGRLTYAQLLDHVDRVAGRLREDLGIGPGDRVAVLSPNRLEVPVLLLGAMRLGATMVPLNPTTSVQDWTYILNHSGARGLFATQELLAGLGPVPSGIHFALPIEELLTSAGAATAGEPPGPLGEQMAVVLYTSGTTGDPKGVALCQRNLLSNAWSMAKNFGLDHATQFAVLPLYHAHAFGFGLMTALLTGGHLVFAERLDPFAWAETIRAQGATVTSVVPTLLPLLLQARVSRDKVPDLRGIMVSSAPLSAELARDFQDRTGIPLIQGWGLSEYTNFACCQRPDGDPEQRRREHFEWEVPSVGAALEGTEVRVVDEQGREVAEGVRGELCVRGHSLMLSYYRDPDNTGRTIIDGWLHTGDQGLYREHGGRRLFFVTGRIKEIIIRGGEKYSPLAIERRIFAAVPELDGRLVVLGFPHRMHGEEIGAYLEAGALPEDSGQRAELERRLLQAVAAMPPDLRPKIILRGSGPIPRTHTGKIQRRKLHGLFAEHQDCKGAVRLL